MTLSKNDISARKQSPKVGFGEEAAASFALRKGMVSEFWLEQPHLVLMHTLIHFSVFAISVCH